ncbi:hypothetical protein SBV1_480035 [Verrucomicrobia bacterium]|nr:hypothetical protein SBV1_480035 [Verrucomicrobiota bacterium]
MIKESSLQRATWGSFYITQLAQALQGCCPAERGGAFLTYLSNQLNIS